MLISCPVCKCSRSECACPVLIQNIVSATEEAVKTMPEVEFFFTTDYPHRWSSGANIRYFTDQGGEIKSLDEAKELAEKYKINASDESRCVTTYGMRFKN